MADLDEYLRTEAPDQALVAEALVVSYSGYLDRFARAMLADAAEADDAVQETLIQAARRIGAYAPGTNLRGWLTTICVNICRTRMRREQARQRMQAALGRLGFGNPQPADPERAALQGDMHAALRSAIRRLDEKHRLVVILRYVQDLPTREIATVLDLPEGTVHSRLYHAHQRLRRELAAAGVEHAGESE